ncbi:MAG: outer membrane protein transport protein [Azovibrio sp.]|uniref:OmpP1/FadL family transporter n=1 Tax=Azovibrio sp. TaxID=1872673 RepID=UPI003C774114
MITNKKYAIGSLLFSVSFNALATSDVYRFVGHGPISAGMGGAATAFDVGVAGIMTNPATLSLAKSGSQVHVGMDAVFVDISVKNTATGESLDSQDHSNNRGPYVAPQLAYMYRGERFAFGAGAFARGGVGTEYGKNSFLSRATGGLNTGLEVSSRLMTLNIPVAASYDVNERLTIGAAVDAVWQGLNLDLLLGADQVGSLLGSGRARGGLVPVLGGLPDMRGAHLSFTKNQPIASGADAWGMGGRIGLIYKFSKDTIFGAAYSLESSLNDMEGDATLTAIDGVAGQIPLNGKIHVKDFQSPAQFNIGFSHKFDDHWMVAADISRIFWGKAVKDIKVGFVADNGANIDIDLPQDYKDQTALSLGVAYTRGDWTIRGGARFATQALRSETLLAVIPSIPNTFGTLGFSYKLSPASNIDFAWTHSFEEKMRTSSLPTTSAPFEVKHAQDSASIAYVYQF